jgi:Spy/CpxP family protein refolding chaperone
MGLRDAIQSSGATEASVRAAAAKVATVEADLAVERLKLYGRISPILTADQREQVKQFQSKIDDFLDGAINRLSERLSAR